MLNVNETGSGSHSVHSSQLLSKGKQRSRRRCGMAAATMALVLLAGAPAGCAPSSPLTTPLTASAILVRARAAAFTDLTGAITIVVPSGSGLSNLTGTCVYTQHP